MLEPIIKYCERLGPGLLAEPLNLFSNAAFFVAAWLAWRLYRKGPRDGKVTLAIALVAVVGVGSSLFHSFANKLTMLADVIPIGVFVYYYLWLALPRFVGLGKAATASVLLGFTAVAVLLAQLPREYQLNGSMSYVPCLLALAVIAFAIRRQPEGKTLALAAMCFLASLTFRSIDYWVCPAFSSGTHFMWHGLNGALLYLLMKALINHCARLQRV